MTATAHGTVDHAPRLGLLVIHNDPVPETEIWRMAPAGVSVHTARFECPRADDTEYVGSPALALADAPDVVRGLDHLGRTGVDSITLCFGSSSFFGGPGFDTAFAAAAARHAHGTPVHTAATAITEALTATAVTRPLVVMPPWFTEPTFRATDAYLRTAGVAGDRIVQFALSSPWDTITRYNAFDAGAHWTIAPDAVHRQVADAYRAAPAGTFDSVLIPGSGFPGQGAVAALEKTLGVPVITSNQAVLWHALRSTPYATVPTVDPTLHGTLFTRRMRGGRGAEATPVRTPV